jgi:hypothetical protein
MILNKHLKTIIKSRSCLTTEHKKKLVKILKEHKNLFENDDCFDGSENMESNVIAKKFNTSADFEGYVSQHRGLEILPKEQQTVINHRTIKPSEFTKFSIKYESTDEFGNNTTTIIKKLKENGKCCWTAFQKNQAQNNQVEPIQEADEEQPTPEENQPEATNDTQAVPQDDKNIEITKSIPFMDEIKGSEILSEFLIKLDL